MPTPPTNGTPGNPLASPPGRSTDPAARQGSDGGDLDQPALHLAQRKGFPAELHQLAGAPGIGEGENRTRLRAEQSPGLGLTGGHRPAIGGGPFGPRLPADVGEGVHLPGTISRHGVDPAAGESSDPTGGERIIHKSYLSSGTHR